MAYREDARPESSALEEAIEPYLGPDEEILHKRGQEIYAVTNERLLILRKDQLHAMLLSGLDEMSLHPRKNGSGRITIGKEPVSFQASGSKATVLDVREDVRRVYRTIVDAQAALKRTVRARVEAAERSVLFAERDR